MKHKLLLCLSSYKRPHFAAFQITRLLALDAGYDLSVSIKGVSEYDFRRVFESEWIEALSSGRLRLTFDPNRGQIHNTLDPMRGLESRYDLFVKIDDDDYYLDRYFRELESYYEQRETLPLLTLLPRIGCFSRTGDLHYAEMSVPRTSGPTLVLSGEFVRYLLQVEHSGVMSDQRRPEDGTLVGMACVRGGFEERPFNRGGEDANPLIYNMSTPSWSRGGYLPLDLQECYRLDPASPDEERVIYLRYRDGGVTARLFGEKIYRLAPREDGRVLSHDEECLEVLWEESGRETFVREASGEYKFSKGRASASCFGFRPAGGTGKVIGPL